MIESIRKSMSMVLDPNEFVVHGYPTPAVVVFFFFVAVSLLLLGQLLWYVYKLQSSPSRQRLLRFRRAPKAWRKLAVNSVDDGIRNLRLSKGRDVALYAH